MVVGGGLQGGERSWTNRLPATSETPRYPFRPLPSKLRRRCAAKRHGQHCQPVRKRSDCGKCPCPPIAPPSPLSEPPFLPCPPQLCSSTFPPTCNCNRVGCNRGARRAAFRQALASFRSFRSLVLPGLDTLTRRSLAAILDLLQLDARPRGTRPHAEKAMAQAPRD